MERRQVKETSMLKHRVLHARCWFSTAAMESMRFWRPCPNCISPSSPWKGNIKSRSENRGPGPGNKSVGTNNISPSRVPLTCVLLRLVVKAVLFCRFLLLTGWFPGDTAAETALAPLGWLVGSGAVRRVDAVFCNAVRILARTTSLEGVAK